MGRDNAGAQNEGAGCNTTPHYTTPRSTDHRDAHCHACATHLHSLKQYVGRAVKHVRCALVGTAFCFWQDAHDGTRHTTTTHGQEGGGACHSAKQGR